MADDKQQDKKIPFEDLSFEERRRLYFSPISAEEAEQLREADRKAAWLHDRLHVMDAGSDEDAESGEDKSE